MMRAFLFLIIIFLGGHSFGQEAAVELRASVGDDDTGKSLAGATIEVYKGGSLFASETSNSSGKVAPIKLPVCIGCTYTIKIKKGGYVTKTALLVAHSDYPEEVPPGVQVQKFDVSIFQSVEGIDFSFLDREPMVEFRVDSYGIVTYDQKKINVMTEKIKDLRKQMEEKKEELAKEKLEAEYAALITDGERAMDAKNWQLALDKFNEALNKKPEESYPKNKIAEIKKNLGAAELKAQKDAEYLALISKGDEQFNNQNYMEAINSYNKALEVKNEQYPKDKILSAKNFMALETVNEEEAAYQKMLKVAQEKFDDKNYEKALELYLRAKNTKPSDPLPQQRIDEINQAMNRANADRDKEEQYTDFLKEADYRFEKGEWSAAKDAYTSAYNLFSRTYPEEQIKKCEGSMRSATDETVEKNYRKIIDIADKNFGEKNYPKAKELYERAIGLKPGDQYPKDQLLAIDKILNPGNYAKAEPL
ncbi:hypothetical protein N8987_07305, partial [Crocinitomix sp.]|nr:hypothetical protein [Crocinitomix sp.]